MFIKETTEVNDYTRHSKFGKLTKYTRTKTLTHWTCDNCSTDFVKIRNGKYNKDSKSYCKQCISQIGVNRLAGAAGYESRIKTDLQPKLGNIVNGKDGYKEIYIGKNYPYREGGYRSIRLHIYTMELHLCRGLEKDEVVHHIDGDKKNNDISNLFLTTTAEHNKLHGASESLIFDLVKQGIVIFNRTTARYEIRE